MNDRDDFTGDATEFRLSNAEERHAESPRTFFIPSRAEREGVGPGDLVRLIFEIVEPDVDGPAAERMWVEVVEVTEAGYVGRLDNEPAALTSIALGSPVVFGPEHITALLDDWPEGNLVAYVSRRSHEDDLRPRFVVRDEPIRPQDSGWQILVGDETPAELDDPGSVLLQPLGFLADRWPELRTLLETGPVGSEWVWDEDASAYVAYTGS